jgi:hypothetical protein
MAGSDGGDKTMSFLDAADPVVRNLLAGARTLDTAAWTVALQNGRRHFAQIAIHDGVLTLGTCPRQEDQSPSHLTEINCGLPAGCRVVWLPEGVRLAAEMASADSVQPALAPTLRSFQQALEVLCGAPGVSHHEGSEETAVMAGIAEAASDWQLAERPDGTKLARLPQKKGYLKATVSDSGIIVPILTADEYPQAVRDAVAEVLLRAASKVRFVRACGQADSGGKWTARLEVPAAVCTADDALTALALVCRDCGAEALALANPELAAVYCDFSSYCRAGKRPTLEEGR